MITKTSKRWPKRSVETFFDHWNPNTAYILGYFAADGLSLAYSGKNVIKLYGFLYPNKSILHLARKRLKLEENH